MKRLGVWVGGLLLAVVGIIAAAWAFGAVWFDGPFAAMNKIVAALVAVAFIVALLFVRPFWRKLGVFAVLFAGVLTWWLTISPTSNRDWQPDVAQKAWADIQGDEVTVHNVRNFEYRSETDYTPHWETRTVQISKLTGANLAINYWGSPWIAHPIASFQFSDSLPLAISIEARKVIGQTYSALRSFFRQYELIYIPADERDAIRVRTNFRTSEAVYLYRLNLPLEQVRGRFLEYMHRINELHARPEWYNAMTSNCTTNIRTQRVATQRTPWDWRILVNGKGDELLYQRGVLDHSVPFAELKRRAYINARAQAANDAPDFSERIRTHLVGEH
jgi:hypothetical protein